MATTTVAFSVFLLTGCGGGNGDSDPTVYDPTAPYTDLTRALSNNYDYSARVLALPDAEAAQKTFLSVEKTALYDADLKRIRSTYPQVKDIAARPIRDPNRIVVTMKDDIPWLKTWYRDWADHTALGDLATGDKAVDAVIERFRNEYNLVKITPLYSESGPIRAEFEFGMSLNTPRVSEQLRGVSSYITNVQAQRSLVDGSTIVRRSNGADGSRNYTFSQKWGDCYNGCKATHDWNFMVSPDGKTVTLVSEAGSPLGEKIDD